MPTMNRLTFLAAIVLVLSWSNSASAQYTWSGSVNTNWSNSGNWSPSGGPPNAAGASASFSESVANKSAVFDAATTVGSITFGVEPNGLWWQAPTYNLSNGVSGSLTLDNGLSNSVIKGSASGYYSAIFAGDMTVAGNSNLDLFGPTTVAVEDSNRPELRFNGNITASGGTVAIREGLVRFNRTNTYGSTTRIDDGAILIAQPAAGLSSNSNLVLNGGQLGLIGGTFTRSLGTGAGEVQWTAGGGFAAQNETLSLIQLNNGTNTVTWGSGGFVPDGSSLLFGGLGYGGVDFQNRIDLNGAVRTIQASGIDAFHLYADRITGIISNSSGTPSGLNKTGPGVLRLSGINTYNGPTTISDGRLIAEHSVGLPTGSNLVFDGGVLGTTSSTFTRSLGTGSGQVSWNGSGGFAATYFGNFDSSTLAIRLNNGTGTVTWGSGGFVPNGSRLILESLDGRRIDFQNGIDLGTSTRTVQTTLNAFTDTLQDRVISGIIQGSGGLTIEGNSTLTLSGTNTYSGVTTVIGAGNRGLRARDGVGLPSSSRLILDNATYETIGVGSFDRTIGTGTGQVYWPNGNAGFRVRDGDQLTVRLNLATTGKVVWGEAGFLGDNQPLNLFSEHLVDSPPNLLNFNTAIDLNGADRTVSLDSFYFSNQDTFRLSGNITDSVGGAGITIGNVFNGNYIVELTGTNSYTGVTRVNGLDSYQSQLRFRTQPGQGLPNSSLLELQGAVLEVIGSQTFSRTLGSNSGQITFGEGAGLGARNGIVAVQLNGGTNTLSWADNTLLRDGDYLRLGVSSSSDYQSASVLDFQNGIDLKGDVRNILIYDEARNGRDNRVWISGVISNSSANPSGLGLEAEPNSRFAVIELTGNNSYNGPTNLSLATLRAVDGVGLPNTTNLALYDGIFETPASGTFSRSIGTANGEVQWAAGYGGGFSAATGVLNVQLNGGTNSVKYGSTNFLSNSTGAALILGSPTATGMVDFQNPIDLDGKELVVRILANPLQKHIAGRLSGVISNGTTENAIGSFTVRGGGVLELTAANTYEGDTTILGSTLLANNTTGSATGTGYVYIETDSVTSGSSSVEVPGRLAGTGSIAGLVYVNGANQIRAGNLNGIGTLTLQTALRVYADGEVGVRISNGSQPSTTAGGSTIGGVPNPTSNNFLNITGINPDPGSLEFDIGGKIVIDGTGTSFVYNEKYSYQIAHSVGQDLSTLDVTDQSAFSTIGFDAKDFHLFGNSSGAVFLNFTPVPEPGTVLGIAAAGLSVLTLGRRWRRGVSSRSVAPGR